MTAPSHPPPDAERRGYRPPVLSSRSRTGLTVAFYVVVGGVLAGILLQVFPLFLPDSLAGRIGHNSEGLLLALVIAAWIQFVRPRLAGTRREWLITVLGAALLLALGVALLLTDLPSRFRTLNEPLLAAALIVPYLQARRPLPRGLAGVLAAVVLLGIIAFNRTVIVTDLAEMLAALVLVPLALDVVDRGILDPRARTSGPLRAVWYAFLVLAPVLFSVVQYRIGVDGLLGEAFRYAVRVTEAFICVLAVEIYFAVLLGRTGRATEPADRSPVRLRA